MPSEEISEDKELKIRIKARSFCKPIDTDKGASENTVEEIALRFYKKGKKDLRRELEMKNDKKDQKYEEEISTFKLLIKIRVLMDENLSKAKQALTNLIDSYKF